MSKTLLLGVAGFPIEHSLSPHLRHIFAKEAGISVRYQRHPVHINQMKDFIHIFKQDGGVGLNLTMPLKEAVMAYVDEADHVSTSIQASNTLYFKDKKIYAFNTDALAITTLLETYGFSIENKRVLICGAGGFAKALVYGLSWHRTKGLWVANRTHKRLEGFKAFGDIKTSMYQDIPNHDFDLIINATSASLQGINLPLPDYVLRKDTMLIDGVYGLEVNPFLHWAKEHGVQCAIDGFGLLAYQAAFSFKIWTGFMPDVSQMSFKTIHQLN